MTMLDERLRRVGAELDRAAEEYAAHRDERAYVVVRSAPRRGSMVLLAAVVVGALVVAFVALRKASDNEDSRVVDRPDALAIAENLGDEWLWPAQAGDIPAASAEEIAREFARRVLGLSDFTVAPDAAADLLRQGVTVHTLILGSSAPEQATTSSPFVPYPYAMRISADRFTVTVMTARVPGSDRWVVYEIIPRPIVDPAMLTSTPTGFRVEAPEGARDADVYVRYAEEAREFRVDITSPGELRVDPQRSAFVSALVVFRDEQGRLINAASLDAESVSERTEIACTFEAGGERAAVSLRAAINETASTNIGRSVARVDVVRSERDALHTSIRVSIAGPDGWDQSSEGSLVRAHTAVLGGSGQGISYSCDAANRASR
jgi:hypothetical protein